MTEADAGVLRGARVLVIEDDPASARLASLVLRAAGAEITVAATATEATRLITTGLQPAVVLLDLDLPDLPGMDLAKVFRTLDETRMIPIIAVTASGIAFGEKAALSAGCDGFVRKPIDTETFPQIVAGFLRPSWRRAPARPTAGTAPSLAGRHQAILAGIPKAICVVRPSDLAMVYANRKFEEITGYSSDELIGRPITIANADGTEGSRAMSEQMRRQLDAGGEGAFEVPRRRADGSKFWVQVTMSRLDDPEHGELWLAVFDDVTARRSADDALKAALIRSETRFSSLWDAGVLAIGVGEVSGHLIDANDLFLGLIGWSREEVAAGRVSRADFSPAEYAAHDAAAVKTVRASGYVPPWEKEYVRKDGTRVPVLVGGALLDPTTYVSYAIDLTEKRRGEAALRESKRRFDALWHSGMVGVVVADADATIVEANDVYLAMIGYTRDDLARGELRYDLLTPPEARATVGHATQQLKTMGFAEPWETESFRKDGARVPVMVGVAAIDGRSSLAIVTDLSARKRAEEQLRRTEDQLRQAQKMEAVGRLAGGIAHDFNNLLSVIVSYTEMMLLDLGANDPMRADVQEVALAAARAAELTRQLSLFSRHQVIESRVLNPNEVLVGMDRMLRRLLGEDVELVALPNDEVGQVQLAPSHLEQVVVNLAVNARDAMPDGGTLTIESSNVELDEGFAADHAPIKPGRYVMLTVSDTGTGMDHATRARIFEPFFTTKPVGKGTGLGLSIVFGIVQQNGGHLWVYSEPGHGTVFKLYFPRVDAEPDRACVAVDPGSLRGTETILLVEDEEQVRKVAHGILRRSGYRVLEARNPGEALLIVESHPDPIDLLLTDVVMPQMSGPQLARRLAALRPRLRVLCMSGYTDDSVARHAVVERGVPFLQKPLTVAALTRKVREVLDGPAPA